MDGKQQKLRIVKAECRDRLTSEDFDFIVSTLGSDPIATQSILTLLSDTTTRDQVLDDKSLFRAIIDSPHDLRISPHLYFYVLVRRALLAADIDDRDLSDYVASMLAHFTLASQVWLGALHEVIFQWLMADNPASIEGVVSQTGSMLFNSAGIPGKRFAEAMVAP